MKKLQMLTAAGGVMLALAGPTYAAQQQAHRGFETYASDRSGAYYYGPQNKPYDVDRPQTPEQHQYNATPYGGQNLPYPDRPYGAPDNG